MPAWTPERKVDEALVRRLVGDQFPELRLASVRFLAAGWDAAVWVIDESWAFRFPLREVVVPGVERELELLPLLAPHLPLPIPVPHFRGRPSEHYPWPFFGARLIPGVEVSDAVIDGQARLRMASALGEFLAVLHDRTVLDAAATAYALPEDANRRADMRARVPHAREALEEVEDHGLWAAPAWVEALLAEAERLPPSRPNALTHGDLHFRQLLLDRGALSGVIDWIDLCHGDRAIDLQLSWSFLPPEARERFFDAYGPVGENDLVRARVLALDLCATLATYGHRAGLPRVSSEAIDGLQRTVAD